MAGRTGLRSGIYDDIDHHCGVPGLSIHTARSKGIDGNYTAIVQESVPTLSQTVNAVLQYRAKTCVGRGRALEPRQTLLPVQRKTFLGVIAKIISPAFGGILMYPSTILKSEFLPADFSGVPSTICYEGAFTEADPARTSREQYHERE